MEADQALEIIKPLADGVDPATGETFPAESLYQSAMLVRALYAAVSALEKEQLRFRSQEKLPANAGKPWSDKEEKQLVRGFAGGHPVDELALSHQRTQSSIRARLAKLGKIESA